MLLVTKAIMLAIGGFVCSFIGGYYFGGEYGLMVGFIGGILPVLSVIMLITKAKHDGFLKLFRDLKEKTEKDGTYTYEKFVHFPDSFGRIRTMIGVVKHPGSIHINGLGDFDDKGDEYIWGNNRTCFALPNFGMTLKLEKALYANKLEKEEGIHDYDSMLKRFFGEKKFNLFKIKFRAKPNPTALDINKELRAVLEEDKPENTLEKKVLGETVSVKNFINFLIYAFNPIFMDGAIMQEKLIERKLGMDYKDKTGDWVGRGKFLIFLLFGLMIFLLVIGMMWDQISPMFSGLFGGGAPPVSHNITGVVK